MSLSTLAGLARNKRILHFGPDDGALSEFFSSQAKTYTTADLLRTDVHLNLDMCAMQLPDSSFDLLVACDVLEHVPDDKSALREIHRILTSGGTAILTVPQKDFLGDTFEDPSVTDPRERERVFGQDDHLRIYGDSFPSILQSHGFDVMAVDHKSFSPALVSRHVLFPPILSKHPLATNYRKVFFARKP